MVKRLSYLFPLIFWGFVGGFIGLVIAGIPGVFIGAWLTMVIYLILISFL